MKLELLSLFLFVGGSLAAQDEVEKAEKALQKILERSSHKDTRSRSDFLCETCNAIVNIVIGVRRAGASENDLENIAKVLCNSPKFGLPLTTESCIGTVKLNLKGILYLIDNKFLQKGSDLCGLILQHKECGPQPKKWKVNVKDGTTVARKLGDARKKPLKILHITDFHYDPEYVPGSNARCGDPLCCTGSTGLLAALPWNRAGYWTDYRSCDPPDYMIIDFLKQLREKYLNTVDLIYFTGDIVSHRIWKTTVENNTKDIKYIMGLFREYLGDKVLFPILGNHEPSPLNSYTPESMKNTTFSTQWLFDLVAEEWGSWLPEETKATIRAGGYYKTTTKEGHCIIALNSNPAYTLNYWLLVDGFDPYGQLQWLADSLQEAEDKGKTCHILTHLPTGDSFTYTPWASEYRRIIERYANTISGQFCGHTHFDELNIYYTNDKPQKPVGVVWNGGSLTPFENVNPNFRLFTCDSQNFELLDFDEYIMDLEEANKNQNQSPVWYKLYSFKEEYGVNSLRPEDISKLAEDMITNKTLRMVYYKNKVRNAAPSIQAGCNKECQEECLTNMVTSVFDDQRKADYVRASMV